MRALFSVLLVTSPACKVKDPLYCDETTPCTDPARPFCDLDGQYPASEGIKRTCIPDPFPDGGDGAPMIVQLASGYSSTCAVFSDGGLRCWGEVFYGDPIGDDEDPADAPPVPTGGPVAEAAIGDAFICVRYQDGNVRCWGTNVGAVGVLGYGNMDDILGVPPSELPNVQIGGPARQIVAGDRHVCALLESGEVRCWGENSHGELGYGNTEDVGNDELPSSVDPVAIGGAVVELTAGQAHTCALLEGGAIRCWGFNAEGRLGYAVLENVGDDETPASMGDVNAGGKILAVSAGHATCVLLEEGAIRCWGPAARLGHPENTEDIGDDEAPASFPAVQVGGPVSQVSSNGGAGITCAVLEGSASVRCWGAYSTSTVATLGYGNGELVGDNETPAQAGDVPIGEPVGLITHGGSTSHTCALLERGAVRCWGLNSAGQLGYPNHDDVGDDETPESMGDVHLVP